MQKKKIVKSILTGGLLLALLLILAFLLNEKNSTTASLIIEEAQKTLTQKENKTKNKLDEINDFLISNKPKELFHFHTAENENLFSKEGIVTLVYENDSLVYWNDNSASIEEYMMQVCLDNPLAKLKNGYFLVVQHPNNLKSNCKIFGLILIKYNYSYQNKYLQNNFHPDLGIPIDAQLIENPSKNYQNLKNSEGKIICGIKGINPDQKVNNYLNYLSVLFFLVFIIACVLFLRHFLQSLIQFKKKGILDLLIITVLIFASRFFMILFSIPKGLEITSLFDFSIFGDANSFFNNNLGNIFLNVISILVLGIIFNLSKLNTRIGNKYARITTYVVFLTLALLLTWYINFLFQSLVTNSSISFDVTTIFKLTKFSFLVFLIFGILFLSFYLISSKIYHILFDEGASRQKFFVFNSIFVCFLLVLTISKSEFLWLEVVWPAAFFSLLYYLKQKTKGNSFSLSILFVILFSFVNSYFFLHYQEKKEISQLKVYSERLVSSRDEIAENLFSDLTKKIKADLKLQDLLFSNPVQSLNMEQRLRQYYLRGYWEKYKIIISAIDSICTPLIKNKNTLYENNSYYDDLINNYGSSTTSENLYFIKNSKEEKINYVGRIPIINLSFQNRKGSVLYLLFQSQAESNISGLPELLLDKSVKTNKALSEYSFEHYKNEKLIQRYGTFDIGLDHKKQKATSETFKISPNGFQYITIFIDKENKLIIGKPTDTLSPNFKSFSFFFVLFSFLLWFLLVGREWLLRKRNKEISLINKVQILVVSIVFLSLFGSGFASYFFIQKQFETKSKNNLEEKMKGLVKELEHDLGDQFFLKPNYKEYASYLLQNFAEIFNSDISLFDPKGNLFASSQPKIYDEGIISKKMSPYSFKQVAIEGKENLLIKEKIGELNYFSAYHSLKNEEGKILAYLNLPYFSKQSELEKEISTYFNTLINIFIILFLLSIITGILISSQITKSIRLIQNQLGKVQLGLTNERLFWPNKDEIGTLVEEYNKMVEKLENSASLLAKSEREEAWREMAKQVAHEIKNPLTPMKLSIQHLLRIKDEDPKNIQERVSKLSEMLIEQIDSLANIADAFSEFAKMPKAIPEKISLNDFVLTQYELYKNSENNIVFKNDSDDELHILADKNQLLRILNNLLKNAIQSIPENRKGEIKINLEKKNESAIIVISDNGCGIKDEEKKNIFRPNFSTKSEGMGLGLAMVKNMVESVDGKIWFESVENEGSSFYISFPIINSKA